MVKCICIKCKKEFETHACWIKKGGGKYCSKECSFKREYNMVHVNEGLKKAKEKGIKVGRIPRKIQSNCVICSSVILNFPSQKKLTKTCSKECLEKHLPNRPRPKGYKMPKITGENHYAWRGKDAISEAIRVRDSPEYKQWRISVLRRDRFTCQICGAKNKKGEKYIFHVDHIKPFSLYPELRMDMNNARTLCLECHKKTDSWGVNIGKRKRNKKLEQPNTQQELPINNYPTLNRENI